jgi:hypothetical protein
MPYLLGLATLIFTIKGLGGSFHAVMTKLGWVTWHAPVVGGVAGALLMATFFAYATRTALVPSPSEAPVSRRHRQILILLFMALVAAAVMVRADRLGTSPIDIGKADMLPLVRAGVDSFLHGENPYRPLTLENGLVYNETYLPGLWMIFIPARALGVDIRWTTIVVQVFFYFSLLAAFLERKVYAWSFPVSALIFLGTVGLHAFSKLLVGQVLAVHTATFTLTLTLFYWAIRKNAQGAMALILPFLVLAREPALLLALPYGAYLLKTSPRVFGRSLAITTAIGLAITLPFIAVAGRDFFGAVLNYATLSATTPWPTMAQYYGLAGPLKWFGLSRMGLFFQLSGLLTALFWVFTGRCRNRFQALALGGVAYVPFLLFVAVTFAYVFIEPLILLYFLMTALPSRDNQ